MRKSLSLVFAFGLLAGLSGGCLSTVTSAKTVPTWVMMNSLKQGTVVAPYDKTYTRWYVLWGLVPLTDPPVGADMSAELKAKGAKYLDGVEVKTGMTVPMIFLNLVTSFVTVYNQQIEVTGNLKR